MCVRERTNFSYKNMLCESVFNSSKEKNVVFIVSVGKTICKINNKFEKDAIVEHHVPSDRVMVKVTK